MAAGQGRAGKTPVVGVVGVVGVLGVVGVVVVGVSSSDCALRVQPPRAAASSY